MNYYADDDVFEDVLFCNDESLNKKRQGKRARALVNAFKEDEKWKLESIRELEQNIESIFEDFIDNRIIDHAFHGNRTLITKSEFVESLAGKDTLLKIDIGLNLRSRKQFPEESYNTNENNPLKWLFSPRYVR